MARIHNLNVNGMSIEDIRTIDTRTLDDHALKQALSRLVSAANKRLRRLMNDPIGKYSPAVQNRINYATGAVRMFSAKGLKTRGQIKAEFERVRSFLDPSKKSHTLKGWRKIVKKMMDKGLTEEEIKSPQFWALYRKFLAEFVPALFDSDQLREYFTLALSKGLTEEEEIRQFLYRAYQYEQSFAEEGTDEEFDDEFGEYYY